LEVNMERMILRLPAVLARTGLSRTTIYRLIAANEFPSSRSIGARAVGWLDADVSAWIDEKFTTLVGAKAVKLRSGSLDNHRHIVSPTQSGKAP
jgi:prophage regulatory protein